MTIRNLEIPDLKLVEMKRFSDARGFFSERFNEERFREQGLPTRFRQDNHSRSLPGVLRGLHYQYQPTQGKLVGCIRGRIWDVAVDLRWDSPTFGKHVARELNEDNGHMLWIPPGFAHGFCVLGDDDADVIYKVDSLYHAAGEAAIHWADIELAIPWPVKTPVLSAKDEQAPSFAQYRESDLARQVWWR